MRNPFAVIVDFVALVGLACVVASGAAMRWVLPPGSEGYGYQLGKIVKFEVQGKTLLGWDRMQWSEIHFWLAAGFVAILVVHFLASWSKSGK